MLWTAPGGHEMEEEDDFDGFEDSNQQERLVDWITEIMLGLIREVMAHRQARKSRSLVKESFALTYKEGQTALDELTEIISLGGVVGAQENFHQSMSCFHVDPDSIEVPEEAVEQLKDFVSMVACMYRDNFFHNFEHASHVFNSVQKLLNRVVLAYQEKETGDYTSNIACDPLNQLAMVFCALIHGKFGRIRKALERRWMN
jgi:hypothetical protein